MEQVRSNWVVILLAIISLFGSSHVLGLWETSWTREDDYITRYTNEVREHAKTLQDYERLKGALSNLNGEKIDVPFPVFVKNLQSEVVYMNHAYETEILSLMEGVDKMDIIGTRGEAMIPFGVNLEELISNDQLTILSGREQTYIEYVGDRCGISYKYPWVKNGSIIGLIGVWVEDNEELKCK